MIEKIQGEKVNLISKNNKWATWISKEKAVQLVEEGSVVAPFGRSNVYKMNYTKKEMNIYIKERDQEHCRICGVKGGTMEYLLPEHMGGLETPVNLIWCCEACNTEKTTKKQHDLCLFIAPYREKNKYLLDKKDEYVTCALCQEEKTLEECKFTHRKTSSHYCLKCVKKGDNFFLLDTQKEFIGIKEPVTIQQLQQKKLAKPIEKNVYILQNDIKQKKCALCYTFKLEKYEMEKRICHSCKETKKEEGFLIAETMDRKKVGKISINYAQELVEKRMATYEDGSTVILESSLESFFIKMKQFLTKQSVIIVSKSGKWSQEGSKKEAKALLEQGIAEIQNKNVIRMTMTIEQFKEKIIKRDRYKCQFCGKRAHGVFSKSDIKTFENSLCACIECEYERDPKKFLKWLNITEEKRNMLMDILVKRKRTKVMWLYEVTGNKKYKINKEIVKKLMDEKMAEKNTKKSARLIYNAQTFREYILEREEKKCHYCNKKGNTVDHVIPKSKGGLTTPKNCVCACEKCNTRKGNTDKKLFIHFLEQTVKKNP
jgi:5-methylcytosine-specific restriction endonuclease McrA